MKHYVNFKGVFRKLFVSYPGTIDYDIHKPYIMSIILWEKYSSEQYVLKP